MAILARYGAKGISGPKHISIFLLHHSGPSKHVLSQLKLQNDFLNLLDHYTKTLVTAFLEVPQHSA